MSKSSLSKIVRTYIEQAKDGSTGYYTQARPTQPTGMVSRKPQPQKSLIKPLLSPQGDHAPLVRKLKPDDPPPTFKETKAVSLNNSNMLQNSPLGNKGSILLKEETRGFEEKDRGRLALSRCKDVSDKAAFKDTTSA
jgi:hypothetical protein